MRRLFIATMLFAVVLLTACAGEKAVAPSEDLGSVDTAITQETEPHKDAPKEYSIKRVIDGDTLVITIAGQDEKVRLIGVNTPESVHPDPSKNVPEGTVASNYTKKLVKTAHNKCTLEYDAQSHDKYGRVLAYVYLDGTMLNYTLATDGYADVMTIQPNSKYADEFTKAVRQAKERNKGIWK